MNKLSVLLALCTFGVVGCDEKKDASDRMNSLTYMKDYRTNICFAKIGINGGGWDALTAVPCTPAVEALLINKREEPRAKPCENQCSKNAPSFLPPLRSRQTESSAGQAECMEQK